jgi:cellulose synthase/poly-beta-1,6-N-acetylglucosamine synthase-like glycosyltransferase
LHSRVFLFILLYQLQHTMFDYLLIICAVVYFILMVALTIGVRSGKKLHPVYSLPSVSVIVAARNEEQSICTCIDSLLRCDYPPDKYELILVNDSSADGTGHIMRGYAKKRQTVHYIETNLRSALTGGKANALAEGIAASSGELLLFTDADCEVPPSWIRKQASYFDDKTGLVGGFTRLLSSNWFGGMQALDWFFLYTVGAGAVGLGKPMTAVGNNLCVRKKAYDEVGGFENLPFSVTEDYILFNAIKETRRWNIRFPLDPETLVASKPCDSVKNLYRQKHRWATGAGDLKPEAFVYFTPLYILHVLLPLFFIFGISIDTAAIAAVIKFAADAIILSRPLSIFGSYSLYRYFLHFQILLFTYVILLPFQIVLKGKVIWKDRSYGEK